VGLEDRVFSRVAVPGMQVAVLVVGTRGDVQPFILLGQRLKADGHRVRLATHAMFRDFVVESGLEFYPLAGDPKKLSAHMVQTGGRLLPNILDSDEIKVRCVRGELGVDWTSVAPPPFAVASLRPVVTTVLHPRRSLPPRFPPRSLPLPTLLPTPQPTPPTSRRRCPRRWR
jgi:UDP:flavonoid glycosyltransferase YjiC (YdhE family)